MLLVFGQILNLDYGRLACIIESVHLHALEGLLLSSLIKIFCGGQLALANLCKTFKDYHFIQEVND